MADGSSRVVFTTEGTERSGRNGMSQPDRQDNAADYTSSRPLVSRGCQVDVRCRWARTLNRPRLGLKSMNGMSVARGNAWRSIETNTAVRFRSHSFARSVADLGFSPDGNWSGLEAQEWEWARNRIIGHGFRTAARTGWILPHFPLLSVSSVVKTEQMMYRPLKDPTSAESASSRGNRLTGSVLSSSNRGVDFRAFR